MNIFTRQTRFLAIASLFFILAANLSLWAKLLEIYPLDKPFSINLLHFSSIALFFALSTVLFLLWVCHGRMGKWVLTTLLLVSSLAAYYMDHYGVVIDVVMINNIFETDVKEIAGLVNASMVLRFLVLGLIPAAIAISYWPASEGRKRELVSRVKLSLWLLLALILSIVIALSNFTGFVKEHKITRLYANPTGWSYSTLSYVSQYARAASLKTVLHESAADTQEVGVHPENELVILVVGETARADRFSLNGYDRPTNPELAKRDVISFKHVSSCGTSTGESVPCMFSSLGREHYTRQKASQYKNALDVLSEEGVQVLWRDNNSDSKGVATRVEYQDFKSPTFNPECDTECRDIGMLSGLDKYIEGHKGKDILIVLHQMGNHGPEYYRRYPQAFEYFKPVCMTGELRSCSQQEINNGYDNAVRYTDYFLANVIDFLKKYDNTHATAMFYVSDHGESLGEKGVYLHAAPYATAPIEQTHVPAVFWAGKHFDYPVSMIKAYEDAPLSHDDLFCALLIAFEMKTKTCAAKDDWLFKNPDVSGTFREKSAP
ncbi:lipid A ethanolaminephosphotransferase [Methylovorus glucosotrophus]|uniref:phosphoethanolamine transferase n=1 Tax=Methylovorus glucosotrophus TaxID=266009 RepID=UPI0013315F1A|nr:phosphoethanolamine--lipid A transferase [Methylovorus glucosotrophus]KAF0844091.1 lipid A ethanolaminephosphotransferase [Methylovorus glucosotrophus]